MKFFVTSALLNRPYRFVRAGWLPPVESRYTRALAESTEKEEKMTRQAALALANSGHCGHLNHGGTFKGGFDPRTPRRCRSIRPDSDKPISPIPASLNFPKPLAIPLMPALPESRRSHRPRP